VDEIITTMIVTKIYLTALNFDVAQLSIHWEVLQVHGTRRGDGQAVENKTKETKKSVVNGMHYKNIIIQIIICTYRCCFPVSSYSIILFDVCMCFLWENFFIFIFT